MENIVYKRDYKEAKAARDKQHRNDIPSQVFDYLITSDALATMNDAYTEMPRVINDGHKAAYERILNALDRIANTFGGKSKVLWIIRIGKQVFLLYSPLSSFRLSMNWHY